MSHNPFCERVRSPEHAPRDSLRVLEHRHGLAEIVERGVGVNEERLPVNPPHSEREDMTVTNNAPRHGNRFAQQRLGFFEAI